MPALLARIGIYVIAAAIALDTGLHYFANFEYHFPFNGPFSLFLLPLGILLVLASLFAKLNANSDAARTRLFLTAAGPSKEKPLEAELQPLDAKTAQMIRRPLWTPFTTWVGMSMVLLAPAIYAGGHYWRSTRTISALDTQLSFDSGHAKTHDFYVNVSDVTADLGINCWPRYPDSLPKVRFTVFQDGRPVAQAQVAQSYHWPFHAKKAGYYSIDIQFLPGPNCLTDQTAHFWVTADSGFYDSVYAFLQWVAVGLVPPGLAVFALSFIRSKRAGFEVSNTADPNSGRPLRWPLRPRFTSLPSRGLISFSLAVPLIIVMWIRVLTLPKRGIWILSAPMISNRAQPEPWESALVLRIDSRRHYYLNSKLIPHEELPDALVRGLARRAERVVYVDGNRDLEFQEVMDVIDTIRGVQARVVLLTPPIKTHTR
ncbi:MAG TPA: hypothetical protein VI685_13650 [Candidatus Angelobacter sp.]